MDIFHFIRVEVAVKYLRDNTRPLEIAFLLYTVQHRVNIVRVIIWGIFHFFFLQTQGKTLPQKLSPHSP